MINCNVRKSFLFALTAMVLVSLDASAEWVLQTTPPILSIPVSSNAITDGVQISNEEIEGDKPVLYIPVQQAPLTMDAMAMASMNLPAVEPDADLIDSLARQLEYDWELMYRYVRNQIRTVPYVGLVRSPERTLLDREGTPMEQVHLYSELLRRIGAETCFNEFTNISLPLQSVSSYDICDLVGVSDYEEAYRFLFAGAMTEDVLSPALPSSTVNVRWPVVGVHFENEWRYFYPWIKNHTALGSPDFSSEMGYSRSNLLATADADLGSDWVTSMDVSAISNALNNYTKNLSNAFTSSNIPLSQAISMSEVQPFFGMDCSVAPQTSLTNIWELLPEINGRLSFEGGTLPSLSLNTYEVAHKKISIRFEDTTQKAMIYVDNELLSIETLGGTAGDDFPLIVTFIQASSTNASTYSLKRGGIYTFCQSYGSGCAGGMSDYINKTSAALQQNGYIQNSPEVLTETLRYIGQKWMDQTAALADRSYFLTQKRTIIRNQFGIMASESDTFYIDVKHQYAISSPGSMFIQIYGLISSALEHAILEQFQPGNAEGVSTVRVLAHANEENMRIYRADSNNWATVKNEISGYDTTAIELEINQGAIYVMPSNGALTIDQWSGGSEVIYYPGDRIEMVIDNMDGGYNAMGTPFVIDMALDVFKPEETTQIVIYNTPESKDPVDMQTGAFLFENTDLTMDGPLPLKLGRSYRSDNATKRSMGSGWVHSYDMHAAQSSSIEASWGHRSAQDIIPFIVGASIIQDLMLNEESAQGWLLSSLVADWFTHQITDNAVTVFLGSKALSFVKQPNGTFVPPPGITVSLVQTNGVYWMKERHGNRYEFDINLNLAKISDPYNNELVFSYNSSTNLQTITSSFGPQFTFNYTGNYLTSVTDNSPTIRSIAYAYDAIGNLTNFTDAANQEWAIHYDNTNHLHAITSLKDPEEIITIQNAYNDFGQVINQLSARNKLYTLYITDYRSSEYDPLGHSTTYLYDAKGRTLATTAPDGAVFITDHDDWGQITQTVNANNITNTFAYDSHFNLLAQTNAVRTTEQVINTFGYDTDFHLCFTTNAFGTAEQTITETTYTTEHKIDTVTVAKGSSIETVTDYNYNSDGLIEQVSEGNGNRVTTYNYDSNSQYGHPKTTTSTDAGIIDYGYDIQGNMKTMTVDGKTSAFGYDARRMLTATTNAFGTADQIVTARTYYDNRLLESETDARGKTKTYSYWDSYKLAIEVFPDTSSTHFQYNDADQMIYSWDRKVDRTDYTVDEVGRVIFEKRPTLSITNQFDAVGNLTNSIVDPTGLNLWATTEYDALNHPLCIQNSLSDIHYSYDALGRATNRTDAASKNWKTEYDELGRVKKSFRPSGNYEEYGFDDLGNRTHFWNADQKPTTFGVDAQGRITSITNAIDKVTEFAFDDAGNLSQRTAADLKVTEYGYNLLNQLVAITNQSIEVATFDHDPNGNVIEATSPLASTTFGYDEMNRLTNSLINVHSCSFTVENQYDLNGNRTNIVYPGGLTVGYEYEADNRLKSVTTEYAENTESFIFGYDSASRMTNIVYPNGINSSFGLDAEGRVVSIQHGTFVDRTIQRNALGFKETELIDVGLKPTVPGTARRIKSHNDADQLTSEWVQQGTNEYTVSYDYSANGCLTNNSETGQSLDYDYDNRLLSVDDIEYIYDASGARIGRIAGGSPATVATNYFIIDYTDGLKRPLAETDASGTVIRYYVWSGSQLLCHIEAVAGVPDLGSVRYYHSDELGSTLALTDSNGDVTDEFAYMPYGYANHTPHVGSSDTPFQWLGGYGVFYDSDIDLHLTLHRAYSSKLKRFIHPDPLGIDGGVNVYAMANQNPLWFIDPYGLCAESGEDFIDYYRDRLTNSKKGDNFPAWNGMNPLHVLFDALEDPNVDIGATRNENIKYKYRNEIYTPSEMGNVAAGYLTTELYGPVISAGALVLAETGELFNNDGDSVSKRVGDAAGSFHDNITGSMEYMNDAPKSNYPMSLGYGYLPE